MVKQILTIRAASATDQQSVYQTHLTAFPEEENQLVAGLAISLLGEHTIPETFSLVAEVETEVVAHIAFSPVFIDTEKNWQGYILAPLAIKPENQKNGLGSRLIEKGIDQLSKESVDMLFVYGDPKYYGKFGFKVEVAKKYKAPYPLEQPFGWQAMNLNKNHGVQSGRLSCVKSLCHPELW